MAVIYNKERAKYGHLTGQVITWPITYSGVPDDAVNEKSLPAGYLKCDGSIYFAADYPQLASILGTGSNNKFIKKNIDGSDVDSLNDNQFMVPDLGSKYPEPTTGANAGVYNSIRKKDTVTGNEKSRSGVAIDAEAAIGETNVRVSYTGSINVPSQDVEIRGKPGWTYAGATHYTEAEGPEENGIHPHVHFSGTNRSRLRAQPASLETDNDNPSARGRTGLQNGSTINLQDWLNETAANNAATVEPTTPGSAYAFPTMNPNPPGSGQRPCNLLDNWDPGLGGGHPGSPKYTPGWGFQTGYAGGCIDHEATGKYRVGSGEGFEFGCLNNNQYNVNGGLNVGSPDGSNVTKYRNTNGVLIFGCTNQGSWTTISGGSLDTIVTVPATYVTGVSGMPVDYNNAPLVDVVPLQSNESAISTTATTDVNNETTDTIDIPVQAGVIPTLHSHRVRLEKGDHNYKVKTAAISIDPENLQTTFDIGVDKSISIDSACQPFIVMEYLIKI